MKWKTVILLLLMIPLVAKAQQRSEWFLKNHPYQTSVNPAERPSFRGFFSLPGLGNVNVSGLSSSITLSDLEWNGSYTLNDQTVEVLAQKAKNKNLLVAETAIPVIGLGFTVGQNYFTLTGKTRIESFNQYNKDLFALRYGLEKYWNSATNQSYNIETNISLHGFHELAAGFNRSFSEKISIGARLKYLKGFSSIQANNLNMTVKRNGNTIQVKPNSTIRTSIPTTIIENEEGYSADIELDDSSLNDLLNPSNNGWGIDLGITYQMTPKLRFGASVTDLGKIKWKQNLNHYTLNTEFTFSEEMVGNSQAEGYEEESGDYWEALKSTFMENMKYQEKPKSYSTSLNTKIKMTAEYDINQLIRLGMLGSIQRGADKWRPSVSVGGNIHPASWLEASLYYTAAYKTADNLGLGFNFNLGSVNLFLASDNILAAFNYKNANYLTTRFGINLVFGRNKATGEEPTPNE